MSVNIQTSDGLKQLIGSSEELTLESIAAVLGYIPADNSKLLELENRIAALEAQLNLQ